ncbi:MAG: Fe-S protein assembly co-chaperone HscB [Myxococcaceae bacterium]
MECWNCQAETHGAAFCPACGRIGPRAPGATHFDVFGIAPGYDVDLPALEKQYRDLSLKLHPDRFTQAVARERRLSLEQTAALNEAWRVLKDPVRRAFYLLRLHGVNLEEEQAAERAKMPMEFLEEVMELREALAEAAAEKDLGKAQQMAGDVEKRRKASLEEAVARLRTLQQDPKDEAARTKASNALGRVRYFSRFLEEVEAIEEEALS